MEKDALKIPESNRGRTELGSTGLPSQPKPDDGGKNPWPKDGVDGGRNASGVNMVPIGSKAGSVDEALNNMVDAFETPLKLLPMEDVK